MAKEEICRMRIGRILIGLGFEDENPEETQRTMRRKLQQIESASGVQQYHPPTDSGNESGSEDGGRQLEDYMETNINGGVNLNVKVNVMSFIRRMSGSEAELIIEKSLTPSDVNPNQARILIPELRVRNQGFLTEEDKIILGNKQDISVWVFDPEGRRSTLNLAKWRMRRSENYVLKTNWNNVVKTNGFKEGMVIQLLSFRVHGNLCFAIDLVG